MSDQVNFEALLIRSFGSELDAAEQATLDAWLAENETNRQTAQQLRSAWDKAAFDKPFVADFTAGLAAVRAKAGLSTVSLEKPRAAIIELPKDTPFMRTRSFRVIRYAAAIAAIVIIAAGVWYQKGLMFNPNTADWQMAENTSLEKQEITLPDQSKVWLKKGARIKYPSKFAAGKREIHLLGTAFFEVAHNPAQVFEVNGPGSARVTVLGTEFEAQFNEHASELSVQVRSGKVRFEGNSDKNILLTAGQKAVFNPGSAQMQSVVADANALFWQSGTLTYDRVPLKDVFAQMEQLFGVKIIFKNAEMANCLFSATFPQPKAPTLLQGIAQLYQMRYSETGPDSYLLEGGICQ
jgi:ferric-dicitrate binding protein FerR (iron transport regulator)